jgi:hypothetical protein
MATVVDLKLAGGYGFAPTDNPEDQQSHAASPQHFNVASATHVVLAVGSLFGLLYGLHVIERVVRRDS